MDVEIQLSMQVGPTIDTHIMVPCFQKKLVYHIPQMCFIMIFEDLQAYIFYEAQPQGWLRMRTERGRYL